MLRKTGSLVVGTVIGLAGLAVALVPGPVQKKAPAPPQSQEAVDFNRDVQPILSKHCWTCHGPDKDANKKAGGLRLDSFAGATKNRNGVRALVPGKPMESMMIIRATTDVEALQMPPKGLKRLTPAEISILKRWIDDGGEYREHWAFIKPTMPALPQKLSRPNWPVNDIDRFTLAKMDQKGLRPEPPADRVTLIRRVSLALTGLPPTPAEVDAFLADRNPGAYERVVSRLLDSPEYGEHQARYWLDAVRYGDTHGLHLDNYRSVWPYRDWVVRAFNEDLSFADFTRWQLAGDLLPKPTTEQLIATGYVRMNPTTAEGGAIEEEFQAKNTFDRVDTTATIFMGMTMACARCHDHKYDPLSQKDYFRMFAFFNSTADPPMDGNDRYHPPVIPAPTPEQEIMKEQQAERLAALRGKAPFAEAREWVKGLAAQRPTVGTWQASGPYEAGTFEDAFNRAFAPETGQGNWRDIQVRDGQAIPNIVGKPNAAAYLRTSLTAKSAMKVELRVGSDDGVRVWLNGQIVHSNMASRPLTVDQDRVELALKEGSNQLLIKIVNGAGQDGASATLGGLTETARKAIAVASKPEPTPAEQNDVLNYYLGEGPESPLAAEYRRELGRMREIEQGVPRTLVAQELKTPRPSYVLRRGEYNLPTVQVFRGAPERFWNTWPKNAPRNRLGLANWFLSEENPLTARVTVNRLWQQSFGTGLVATPEDFGTRAGWPSHPELLDYLAVRFVRNGWKMKDFHRMVVTSATFRQSAAADKAKREKDPENRYLARGPRFRLDAEVIRDQALFASGLLVDRIGGPGVRPYQPPGIWEIITFPSSDTATYVQDRGDNLYRRSIYTFWKRTSPPPTLLLFDAPMRESCVVHRSRTNTPLQALATMNDPQFFEASRALAQRVLREASTDEERVDRLFRLVTARKPTDKERSILLRNLRAQRTQKESEEQAARALAVGESPRDTRLDPREHAAWTMLANLVLNLDEALTQH